MSTTPDRYLPIDEEGYFVFEHTRVTDADIGRPLLDNLMAHEDGNRFVTSLNGQQAWVESFDEPLVARHVSADDAEHGVLDLVYGAQAKFSYASLTVDEWDRFHGRSEKGVPFVFSRQAQMEFFELLEEFDDDSITVQGKRFPVPAWLSANAEVNAEPFWTNLYKTAQDGWDSGQESVILPTVLPQLKLTRQRVLVLGCGAGHDAAYLAQQGHVVTAVDFSSEAVQRAKANYSGIENLKLIQADVFDLPRDWNERFDLIFEHTLYCAIAPERRNDLVKVWTRALAPHGNLLGVFFAMEKRGGPPFGGSEREVRERLKNQFEFLFWNRWRHSTEARRAKEFVVFARLKGR